MSPIRFCVPLLATAIAAQGVYPLAAQNITGYESIQSKKAINLKPGETADVKASCPDGKVALGGGAYTHTDRDSTKLTLVWSAVELEKSWVVGYSNNSAATINSEIFAQVICASVK